MTARFDPARQSPGHWPPLAQPSVRIALDLPASAPADWPRIDEDLLRQLGIAQIAEPTGAEDLALNDFVVQLTRRIVTVAGALLRGVRYPSFDAGHLLSVSPPAPDRPRHRVWLRVPCVELLPPEVFRLAWRQARDVALGMVLLGPAEADTRLDAAREALAQAAAETMPGGDSTIPLLKAAHTLGIPCTHLGAGVHLLGMGSSGRKFDRSSIESDSALGARISSDKSLNSALSRLAGLPVPASVRATTATEAAEAAISLGFPVVLKPADRDRGEGVHVDLADTAQVRAAFDRIQPISTNVVVEKQVNGTCHRILVADRTVTMVIRRNPKAVRGDGERTIRELIERANARNDALPAPLRQTAFPSDALAVECLRRAGLTLDDIPTKGRLAPLRPIETADWGGSPDMATGELHPENAALAVRAARLLGLRVLGLDFVSEDISIPWHRNGGMIIEANFAPQVVGLSAVRQEGIEAMLRALVPDLGRIPIGAFVGGPRAFEAAQAWGHALSSAGKRAHLTSHRTSAGPEGANPLALVTDGLFERARALMLDPDVDAIGLVIQTDEPLYTGLPVDRIDHLEVLDSVVEDAASPGFEADAARVAAMIRLLEAARRKRA